VYPVLPLIGNVALGVGALSYAGTLTVGVVADETAYPDLDVLVAALRDELAQLGAAMPAPTAAGVGP
jgi:diacylglycerol O-acyltransferase / wax synthase